MFELVEIGLKGHLDHLERRGQGRCEPSVVKDSDLNRPRAYRRLRVVSWTR